MGSMNSMELFRAVLFMQLFFAVAISLYAYSLPADALGHAEIMTDLDTPININQTSVEIQESMEQQTDIPLIDVGALIFYSGNIIIDLVLNFLFAIPQMIQLLIDIIMTLANINAGVITIVKIFAGVATTIFYMISVMTMLIGIRSGRVI